MQLFSIIPIHLEEEPTRHAILGEITCDSDGKVDAFIDCRDVKRTLALYPFHGGDYYLGAFAVGAYQESLGDLHNLFGDTNAAHVRLSRMARSSWIRRSREIPYAKFSTTCSRQTRW